MKSELCSLKKCKGFVLANQRVDTWNHKSVETWYQECQKVHIGSDIANLYIMNRVKA